MERLTEEVTRGNVAEVKVVLASVILGLAVYQLLEAREDIAKERAEQREEARERREEAREERLEE